MAPITKLSDSPPDPLHHAVPPFSGGDVTASSKRRKPYHEPGKNINSLKEEEKVNSMTSLRHQTISSNSYPHERPYDVAIDTVPVTIERLPYIPSEGDKLVDPGTARASIAADNQHPQGTTDGDWAELHKTETVVQQHCLYFDRDRDGIIYPHDTFIACRKWGWGIFLSTLAAIYIKNVHKAKHGSDSMSFDNEGRFSPQKYEDLFAKYDRGNKGGLDWSDLFRFHKGQRMAMDFFGWSAVFFEWLAVYLLLWPEDGLLRKDDVRRVFDGSIFEQKAQEHSRKLRACPVSS